jgi:SAM-dependent methyltransferase
MVSHSDHMTHADDHHDDHHHHHHGHSAGEPTNWDERYAASDRLWSGAPNQALVAAVATLTPGRVLDVGCGEGADAVWLAQNGWTVTGLDVSGVALERAARHAVDAGVSVTWLHSGLVEASVPAGSFDLVSAQYPVLARTPDLVAEHVLIDAVAPGGTLVVVHHADFKEHDPNRHTFNPAQYVGPWDLAAMLGEGWSIEVDETRPRNLTDGAGAGHSEDVVLVARRVEA